MSSFNEMAARFLGKKDVCNKGEPGSFLVALPRALARAPYHIVPEDFYGYDVWHAYEATFLTCTGLVVAGTLKIVYSAQSPFIVESKSLKLYLNTFDMRPMGKDIQLAIKAYEVTLKKDLERVLKTDVSVHFHNRPSTLNHTKEVTSTTDFYAHFINLYDAIAQHQSLETLDFTSLSANENYLTTQSYPGVHMNYYYTHILRTRCRVTQQKDSGYAYFFLRTKDVIISPESLLKSIIALREKEEFHEFCAEYLYTQLRALRGVEEMYVWLLFARRGSIDINPIRASEERLIPPHFPLAHVLTPPTPMQ